MTTCFSTIVRRVSLTSTAIDNWVTMVIQYHTKMEGPCKREAKKRLIAGMKREITGLGDELVGLSVEASRARTADRIRKEEKDA